ncbi:MAG TPA: hypothetical protein VLL94_11390 [Nitrospiraceae bacterium]|nr:hypothetical protein [Nitrospiraceae bacterium]
MRKSLPAGLIPSAYWLVWLQPTNRMDQTTTRNGLVLDVWVI